MASGTSSLESNDSNASMSHGYASNERQHATAGGLPMLPIPLDFDSSLLIVGTLPAGSMSHGYASNERQHATAGALPMLPIPLDFDSSLLIVGTLPAGSISHGYASNERQHATAGALPMLPIPLDFDSSLLIVGTLPAGSMSHGYASNERQHATAGALPMLPIPLDFDSSLLIVGTLPAGSMSHGYASNERQHATAGALPMLPIPLDFDSSLLIVGTLPAGSMSHGYASNERQHAAAGALPTLPIPLDFDVLGYDKQKFTKGHGYEALSGAYEPLAHAPYDAMSKPQGEGLKQQCEKALHDLNALRRQHSETSRRCEHAMKELEYFRGQHRAAMNQLEVSAQEANTLRGKYGDLLNDNQRLEREVQHLHECGGAGEGVGGSDTALMHTLRKYDSLKEEYECFQKRYEELISTHSSTVEKLQLVQEENSRLKGQCHDLTQERNAAIRERNALKQQCASAVRQWEGGLRERAELRAALAARAHPAPHAPHAPPPPPDIKRLTDERNAAMHEYTLIMSERDTVHKEMEKLSDDLQAALKRVAALESALQASRDEQRTLALQAETLRREIASALQDRDRALKECSDLKAPQNTNTLGKSRQDNPAYHHLGLASGALGKDGFVNGPHAADTSLDKFQGLVGMVAGAADKERVDNLEVANQELERLRKNIDRLQAELQEAHQEAEVSKRRRDWAFSERDKIVQERESIRTLCDRLRKERDRAVSDLAEALRDSDDIKKQRNEASKELKELKEKLESELDKETPSSSSSHSSRRHAAAAAAAALHGHSRDSAIDVDIQDYEWETLEVELSGEGQLGLELAGGREEPYCPNDYSIYVTAVHPGTVADGKLKVLDRVTEACGVSVWASGRAAAAALHHAHSAPHGAATLRVQRARARRHQLRLPNHRNLGISLQHGIYIGKITSGSIASKEDNLFVGDRLININNRSLDGMKSVSEATMLLNDCQYDSVTLTVLRPLYSGPGPSVSPPVPDLSHRFSPIREGGKAAFLHPYHTGKMVNSCSQTEEPWCQYHAPTDTKPHAPAHAVTDFDGRYVYHVAASSHGKMQQERGTWEMILGKIEAVTGRSKSKDKQNKSTESDAIAELDSVLESYHGKTSKDTGSVLKRSKRRNKDGQNGSESAKNNGGTWPKARANVILEQNPTGTIVQSRSKKERPALSILLSPPTKLQPEPQRSNTNRNSNPIPLGHQPLTQSTAPARHSVYKSIESSVNPASAHFPKSAPLSIHNPFASPNVINFDKLRSLEKEKMAMAEYSEHDMTPNRLSLALNPSDDSLDYQPVTRNRNKSPHSLDFMGPNSAKGPSSLDFVSTNKSPSSIEYSMKGHPGKDILEHYYSSKKSSSPKTIKYPSDSDSFGPDSLNSGLSSGMNMGMTGTLPTQSRLQSQFYRGPFVNPHPHHPTPRYPHPASPTNIPQSQSGESIGTSYEIAPFTSHSHNMSDLQPSRTPRAGTGDYHHTYEGGTFPRKKENQRFRIPSNPSVTSKNSAGKLSTGSIERSSERNSPMPTFHVEVLSPGRGAKQLAHKATRNSMPEYCGMGWSKPLPGELRRVHIDKSQQPLGIQISCPPGSGGVFVSTVNEHSLASRVGLQVGDQLLEVCGINMRSATYKLAANVLRQCGNSITMLVQYSPDKYNDLEGSGSSSSGESSHEDEVSLSGSPTPRNSPGPQQSSRLETPSTEVSTSRQSNNNKELPRFLLIEMRNCSDLGISLVGGNAVGIFVHSVQIDSPAYNAGLRTGDQILEYNNADLRHATAEQAALELAKPADKVSVLVRHDIQQYHEIKDKPGDAFYIRAGFDRGAKITSTGMDSIDPYSLWFRRDEVLFVDNTLFNGAPGLWRAWQLDYKGSKQQWGTIPSKFKVEELLRRSMGSLEGGDTQQRRGSTSARRSFFRRKKHRDSKELASFSNTNLGWWSDSGTLTDELPVLSYQRVERLHYGSHRPVVVLGPLWESVVEKLVSDWPGVFARARWEHKRSQRLDCVALQAVRAVCDKGMHCVLDVSVESIEKLHKQQMYPIVLLIKFKSTKQIKEVKDTRYPMDKVSAKAAKEMYEHALKLETEYRNYISAVIPAGVNIAYMCTQLKAAVEEEQSKTLWVPSVQA